MGANVFWALSLQLDPLKMKIFKSTCLRSDHHQIHLENIGLMLCSCNIGDYLLLFMLSSKSIHNNFRILSLIFNNHFLYSLINNLSIWTWKIFSFWSWKIKFYRNFCITKDFQMELLLKMNFEHFFLKHGLFMKMSLTFCTCFFFVHIEMSHFT